VGHTRELLNKLAVLQKGAEWVIEQHSFLEIKFNPYFP
jgi:hypothetical protein